MLSREIVHVGRRIRVGFDTVTGPDGTVIKRDVILHPGAVVILPVLDAEHVVLLRNHRWVVGETLWELPAGTLEPGEDLLEAAKRELLEETGYSAKKWQSLGFLYASPGVLDEKLHLFVAEGLTPGEQDLEADEQIEPKVVRLDEAVRKCLAGEVKDAKTITAILLWERFRRDAETTNLV
jgi:ADP-ribose pyrophosphatase